LISHSQLLSGDEGVAEVQKGERENVLGRVLIQVRIILDSSNRHDAGNASSDVDKRGQIEHVFGSRIDQIPFHLYCKKEAEENSNNQAQIAYQGYIHCIPVYFLSELQLKELNFSQKRFWSNLIAMIVRDKDCQSIKIIDATINQKISLNRVISEGNAQFYIGISIKKLKRFKKMV
jgi:hypothetical protein